MINLITKTSIGALFLGAVMMASCGSADHAGQTNHVSHANEVPAVAERPAETADYTVTEANRTVRIEVAANGYTPKTISTRKGEPVKLEFLRKDSENCGDEVVFPALNIRRKLPVGKVVAIDITPESSGDLKFTCGMDMLRGKLIVTE
jgi:plastocyanin domain-containing protein